MSDSPLHFFTDEFNSSFHHVPPSEPVPRGLLGLNRTGARRLQAPARLFRTSQPVDHSQVRALQAANSRGGL